MKIPDWSLWILEPKKDHPQNFFIPTCSVFLPASVSELYSLDNSETDHPTPKQLRKGRSPSSSAPPLQLAARLLLRKKSPFRMGINSGFSHHAEGTPV